ncbi:MAG: hypothetical protein EOR76_33455 [Mesorhizobium sp.]|nr:MAG: hypothetical protein EOR49_33800 [Mesorhizobium sp.]RWM42176.1 MAG: hypothetical protein EOR76_33455 [Mesorhizobium sp.]
MTPAPQCSGAHARRIRTSAVFTGLHRTGTAEIDSNIVERAIRPQTIIRKNSLFAGSEGGGHSSLRRPLNDSTKPLSGMLFLVPAFVRSPGRVGLAHPGHGAPGARKCGQAVVCR